MAHSLYTFQWASLSPKIAPSHGGIYTDHATRSVTVSMNIVLAMRSSNSNNSHHDVITADRRSVFVWTAGLCCLLWECGEQCLRFISADVSQHPVIIVGSYECRILTTLGPFLDCEILWILHVQDITTPHHNCLTVLFPGPPGWASTRRELLNFMVQGKINRGRDTDHPAGRHSIRYSGLTSAHLHHAPVFTGQMPFLPPNQQCPSTEGN